MKNVLCGVSLVILFSLISVRSHAAKFYNINFVFGISMRGAYSVCEDQYGFIWASSRTGIIRLTEEGYRMYRLSYEPESVNVLNAKLVYNDSRLLAYTDNGQIFVYDPIQDEFKIELNLGQSLNNSYLSVYNVFIDSQGVFWIASSVGLLRYDGVVKRVIGLGAECFELVRYDSSRIIVTDSDGIWLYDTVSFQADHLYDNSSMILPRATTLCFDPTREHLWIGTLADGLYCFNMESHSLNPILKSSLPSQPIRAITEYTDSSWLVGIDGQGIWEISADGHRILNVHKENADDPSSLRGNGVQDVYRDNKNRVWVCTYSGGVSFFRDASASIRQLDHQINNRNSLVNNNVSSVLEDRKGKLWFATDNGISCYDPLNETWKSYYSSQSEYSRSFTSLCEDDKGRIWAGSFLSGLYILDTDTGREIAHYPPNTPGKPVRFDFIIGIYKDDQGDIWISNARGELVCYVSDQDNFVSYPRGQVGSFAQMYDGKVLLGSNYALSLLDKQTGHLTRILSDLLVNDLLTDGNDIWICTGGEGLMKYDYNTGSIAEKYSVATGLPSNYVNSILYEDGYMWVGTENGVCRIDPSSQSVYAFSSIGPFSMQSYNRGSRFRLHSGELAWGTNNGVIIFSPATLQNIQATGKLFFQNLFVSGQSVRDRDDFKLTAPLDSLTTIHLPYPANSFSLELLPLDAPRETLLSWMLEGFDKEWWTLTNNRTVSYTNLPAGKFILTLRLLDGSMSNTITERQLTVYIARPFWMKWWFRLVAGLVAVSILLWLISHRMKRIKQIRTEENERFFANAAQKIYNSLILVNSPIEELSQEKSLSNAARAYLDVAVGQSKRLSAAVTHLINFQKMGAGKKRLFLTQVDIVKLLRNRCARLESTAATRTTPIHFNSDHDYLIATVDEGKITEALDHLLSNAVKYSPAGSGVGVELSCDDTHWTLEIRDYGAGISKKDQRQLFKKSSRVPDLTNAPASGIRLRLVRDWVRLHHGSIVCESRENEGTTFRIRLPLTQEGIRAEEIIIQNKELRTDNSLLVPNPYSLPGEEKEKEVMSVALMEKNLRSLSEMDFGMQSARDGEEIWLMIKTAIQNQEANPKRQVINEDPTGEEFINELNDKFLKRATEVVAEKIADPAFGKEDFASAMHVSTSLLYKRLKALTGLSPHEFIKTARLNHALELLRSRRYGVTEVSELCGFSSVGYFSTVFRKHFGKPPSDFINKP